MTHIVRAQLDIQQAREGISFSLLNTAKPIKRPGSPSTLRLCSRYFTTLHVTVCIHPVSDSRNHLIKDFACALLNAQSQKNMDEEVSQSSKRKEKGEGEKESGIVTIEAPTMCQVSTTLSTF